MHTPATSDAGVDVTGSSDSSGVFTVAKAEAHGLKVLTWLLRRAAEWS